ncbi:MAG: HAD family hydrolase [Desulfovibrionaceae bacterium]
MAEWAALFDMDGVIADTNPFHRSSWRAFCAKHGLSLSEKDLERRVYGRTNTDTLRDLFGLELSPERIHDLSEEKERLFRQMATGKLSPLPGLAELIAELQRSGTLLAVATSAPPDNASMVLRETGLAQAFATVVDASMVARGKPAPDVYLAASARLDVPPRACVVFEDSLSGVAAGRSAGMAVVGLATTHPVSELAPLTDLCAQDFREIGWNSIKALLADRRKNPNAPGPA